MTIKLSLAIPALPVRAIASGTEFYREKLGFAVVHQEGGFAIVKRDCVEIHLWEASDESWRSRAGAPPVTSGAESFLSGTASCRIAMTGIEELYSELLPLGIVHRNAPLKTQPWGCRDFAVTDVDGNLVTFFEDF